MMAAIDAERPGQLARASAEFVVGPPRPSDSHGFDASERLKGSEKYESGHWTVLDQNIEQPVNPVVQINVGVASRMIRYETTGSGPEKRVAGWISLGRVGLRFHDAARTTTPFKGAADEIPGTVHGSSFKKFRRETLHARGRWGDR